MNENTIGFIGAGNMANALISGLIISGRHAETIMASSPEQTHLDKMESSYGVKTTSENNRIFEKCNTIILAVKPNILPNVLENVSSRLLNKKCLIISIAAGVTIKDLESYFNPDQRIIRAMPNTPASIQSGVTGLCRNIMADNEDDTAAAENIFNSVGSTCWIKESSMDLYTALIGSGPAYIFYLLESLLDASKDLHLENEITKNILIDMFIGSAKLAKESKDTPEILRKKVTSPGGVTQRAIEIFDENKIKESIILAIKEASKKSQELGN